LQSGNVRGAIAAARARVKAGARAAIVVVVAGQGLIKYLLH
jgi:hypothetical protein